MNISFVCNGRKTQMFHLIAEGLKSEIDDLDVFYFCCGRKQRDYLISDGVPQSHILLLNWERGKEHNLPIGDYKLNELAGYDRAMKNYLEGGLMCLTSIQRPFYDYVKENSIKFVFGEMTWAHEILMARICQDKFRGQCHYLHPQSIRIPNGRFCFMDNEFQDSIFQPTEYIHPREVLSDFEIPIKPVVPQRVADVAADVKASMSFNARFKHLMAFLIFNRFKKFDNTLENLQALPLKSFKRRKKAFMLDYNKEYYMRVVKKHKWEEFKDKKYVFITLHMQPEASIDVVGRYYDDQLQNIKNVWRILPSDCYLVVKEHTNAIGNRGRSFFKQLQSIRNVIIPDENISSHLILNNSIGVFTNSGTVALESGLYKKHAFLFSGIFFDKLKYCHRVTLEDFKYCKNFDDLKQKCIERDEGKMDLEDYSEYIIRSSFPGIIDPHNTSNLFEEPDNIKTIVGSFKLLLCKFI